MRNRIGFFEGMIIALVGIFSLVYGLIVATSSNDSSDTKPPTTLVGKWHQTQNGIDGVVMTARIYPDSIEITMQLDNETTSTFWDGTFNSNADPRGKSTIVSKGNRDILNMSLFGSNEKSKTFAYNKGDLSYQFSMMGVSTIVHMSKD